MSRPSQLNKKSKYQKRASALPDIDEDVKDFDPEECFNMSSLANEQNFQQPFSLSDKKSNSQTKSNTKSLENLLKLTENRKSTLNTTRLNFIVSTQRALFNLDELKNNKYFSNYNKLQISFAIKRTILLIDFAALLMILISFILNIIEGEGFYFHNFNERSQTIQLMNYIRVLNEYFKVTENSNSSNLKKAYSNNNIDLSSNSSISNYTNDTSVFYGSLSVTDINNFENCEDHRCIYNNLTDFLNSEYFFMKLKEFNISRLQSELPSYSNNNNNNSNNSFFYNISTAHQQEQGKESDCKEINNTSLKNSSCNESSNLSFMQMIIQNTAIPKNIPISLTVTAELKNIRVALLSITIAALILLFISRYLEYVRDYIFFDFKLKEGFLFSSHMQMFLVDLLFLAPFQYPGLEGYTIETNLDTYMCLPYSTILSALCYFRGFYLIKALQFFSEFISDSSEIICERYACKPDSAFAIKAYHKEKPFQVLLYIFLLTTIIFGFNIRLFEMTYWEGFPDFKNSGQNWVYISNSFWCVLISITTVGFGDFYPKTHPGRVFIILACGIGLYFVSMLMFVITQKTILNEREYRAFRLITRIRLRSKMKEKQAWLIYHFLKTRINSFRLSKKAISKEEYDIVDNRLRREMFKAIEQMRLLDRQICEFENLPPKEILIDVQERVNSDLLELVREIDYLRIISQSIKSFNTSQLELINNVKKNTYGLKIILYNLVNTGMFGELCNINCTENEEFLKQHLYLDKGNIEKFLKHRHHHKHYEINGIRNFLTGCLEDQITDEMKIIKLREDEDLGSEYSHLKPNSSHDYSKEKQNRYQANYYDFKRLNKSLQETQTNNGNITNEKNNNNNNTTSNNNYSNDNSNNNNTSNNNKDNDFPVKRKISKSIDHSFRHDGLKINPNLINTKLSKYTLQSPNSPNNKYNIIISQPLTNTKEKSIEDNISNIQNKRIFNFSVDNSKFFNTNSLCHDEFKDLRNTMDQRCLNNKTRNMLADEENNNNNMIFKDMKFANNNSHLMRDSPIFRSSNLISSNTINENNAAAVKPTNSTDNNDNNTNNIHNNIIENNNNINIRNDDNENYHNNNKFDNNARENIESKGVKGARRVKSNYKINIIKINNDGEDKNSIKTKSSKNTLGYLVNAQDKNEGIIPVSEALHDPNIPKEEINKEVNKKLDSNIYLNNDFNDNNSKHSNLANKSNLEIKGGNDGNHSKKFSINSIKRDMLPTKLEFFSKKQKTSLCDNLGFANEDFNTKSIKNCLKFLFNRKYFNQGVIAEKTRVDKERGIIENYKSMKFKLFNRPLNKRSTAASRFLSQDIINKVNKLFSKKNLGEILKKDKEEEIEKKSDNQ